MKAVKEQRLSASGRRNDEERADVGFRESGTGLDLVLAVKTFQGLLGDVDPAGLALRLHLVGRRDVIRPDVVLPLAKAQNSAEDPSSVNSNSHVQGNIRGFDNRAAKENLESYTAPFIFHDEKYDR